MEKRVLASTQAGQSSEVPSNTPVIKSGCSLIPKSGHLPAKSAIHNLPGTPLEVSVSPLSFTFLVNKQAIDILFNWLRARTRGMKQCANECTTYPLLADISSLFASLFFLPTSFRALLWRGLLFVVENLVPQVVAK